MKTTHILTNALTAVVLAGAGFASAQSPVSAPAAAHTFKLGDFTVTTIRDAEFEAPNNAKIFGANAGPEAVGKVLAAAGARTDKITLSVDTLLVKTPHHLVLLDTGLGPDARGVLMDSLAKVGVSPSDVTDVLITHSHGDHVGGLATADGKTAFPNATVRMSTKEWAWMQSQARAKSLVSAISSQVRTFEAGKQVLPGITPIAIDGHTPGHMGYEVVSKGHRLLDIGDTAHSSIVSLAKPDWTMGFDSDAAVGAASRRATLTRLSKTHELIFAPHFPFPGVGRIEAKGDGFIWRPDVPR